MFQKFCREHKLGRTQRALFEDWLRTAGFDLEAWQADTLQIILLYQRFTDYMAARISEMRKLAALFPPEG